MPSFNKLNGDYEVNYVVQVHLGDAIWSQKLISELSNGKPIIWGTESQFVEGLQRAYPNICWVDVKALNPEYQQVLLDCIIGGVRIIPIGHANTIMKVPYKDCMKIKYTMYGYDWNIWTESKFQRYSDKEQSLYELLGLKYGDKYNLINNRFRSDESGKVSISVQNDFKNIHLENIKGYSLFDWSYVIENASTIHTVGTSINYIIELLEIKAKEVHLYKRLPDENHYQNYDYILKKHKYIYH